MNPPILITGAAGYIGSHALQTFRAAGRAVVALDDFSTGNRWAVPKDVPLYEGDFADEAFLRDIHRRTEFRTILHFAAKTSVEESVRMPDLYRVENLEKTERLGKVAVALGVRDFIFSSTCAVYGSAARGQVSEMSATLPDSPYGATKLAAEQALFALAKAGAMRVAAIRYFNVAGASTSGLLGAANPKVHSLVTLCAEVAAGKRSNLTVHGTDYPTPDGTGVRDYIHVDDLVQAHLDVLTAVERGADSGIFNCGYGRPYSVREVVAAMEAASGRPIPLVMGPRRAGDIDSIYADATKIKQLTAWRPRLDELREICRSAYAWEKKKISGGA